MRRIDLTEREYADLRAFMYMMLDEDTYLGGKFAKDTRNYGLLPQRLMMLYGKLGNAERR